LVNGDIGIGDNGVGDIVEAEMLSRKSIQIMERIQGPDFNVRGNYLHTLSHVLHRSENVEEVRDLLEQCLAIFKRINGESKNVALVSYDLATFHARNVLRKPPGYLRTEDYNIAVLYRMEAVRISTALYGHDHFQTRFFERNDIKYTLSNYNSTI
jgi:hypothetical protein